MAGRRPVNRRHSGVTLVEMLIALAIFSVVVGAIVALTGHGEKIFMKSRREIQRLKDLSAFLGDFSDSVKNGKSVQYISAREIGIWKEDTDKDGRPYADELVSFVWDGRTAGTVYRRVGYDESPALTRVDWFELSFDEPAPNTRHVLLRVLQDGRTYQTSLVVRNRVQASAR